MPVPNNVPNSKGIKPTTDTNWVDEYDDDSTLARYYSGFTQQNYTTPVIAYDRKTLFTNEVIPVNMERMKRPWIGITCAERSSWMYGDYVESVWDAGGMPVELKPGDPTAMVGVIDGLILTGGRDIDPAIYGEQEAKETQTPDRALDDFEISLLFAAMHREIPVLGVCRGHQLINAALGGTLFQHISGHTYCDHDVLTTKNSLLRDMWKAKKATVNSRHHQAVKVPGFGMKVTARTADGIIEATENTEYRWMMTTQFHPEALTIGQIIFRNLIKEATYVISTYSEIEMQRIDYLTAKYCSPVTIGASRKRLPSIQPGIKVYRSEPKGTDITVLPSGSVIMSKQPEDDEAKLIIETIAAEVVDEFNQEKKLPLVKKTLDPLTRIWDLEEQMLTTDNEIDSHMESIQREMTLDRPLQKFTTTSALEAEGLEPDEVDAVLAMQQDLERVM